MTAPACPVCTTPHEADATVCAFCGLSLVEPAGDAQTKPERESELAPADAPPASAPDEAPTEAATPADEPGADIAPATATATSGQDAQTEDATDTATPMEAESAETPAIPVAPAPARPRAPSFARARTSTSAARRAHRIEWSVIAALAVVLLVQMVASDFDQLAAGPVTRPWLQRACNALHCRLPAWREPQALHLLQRDVRANPRHPGTLRISAGFRNDARWAQPWPRLRVVLSDADGRAIAARDFAANEYLGATPAANGIASGQVAGAAFDVVDPSPRVTAFTFEFRPAGVAGAATSR